MKLKLFTFLAILNVTFLYADVIDFDGLAGTNLPGNSGTFSQPYGQYTVYSGDFSYDTGDLIMDVDADTPSYFVTSQWDAQADASRYTYNGTDVFELTSYPGQSAEMTLHSNGDVFNIYSLEMDSRSGPYDWSITISGERSDATLFSDNYTLIGTDNMIDQDGNDLTLYDFGELYTNIVSFSVLGYANGAVDNLVFDNIEYSMGAHAPVPEPTSSSLLMLGLLGLGFRRRKS